MNRVIYPPATLGMLGGGQLGRFFVAAAHEMGYQVWVLDPDPKSPAGKIADRHLCVSYDDHAALDEFASACAAVTTEFENVPAATLEYLAKFIPVRPNATAVAICQQRVSEKNFLRDNGFPHGSYREIKVAEDLLSVPTTMFPAILKIARFGYDGKGQAVVENVTEAQQAFAQFKGETCVLEQRLQLDYEISVVLARDAEGHVRTFPVAENRHQRGILDVSIAAPGASAATADLTQQAERVAVEISAKLGYIGTMGVEFFVSQGQLFVNEMAPRPHNSGHYTIDACVSDQFEQQVRALCGLPLGDSQAHSAAVMVNLLGDLWYHGETYREPDWSALLAVPNLKLHLYGKHHARPGRKMGHFTVIDNDPERALALALQARAAIGIAL